MARQAGAVVGILMLFLAGAAAAQYAQQGAKLVGTGFLGAAGQGASVAISGDGNTAVVGGPHDNSNAGAAWMFKRSGAAWAQLGVKTVGRDAIGPAYQGTSVAVSADGTVTVVGGYADNSSAGLAWVYSTLWLGLWQQAQLSGSGAVGTGAQGVSVAVSADGTTAIVGGPWDNSYAGAAWVFASSGGAWTQQGGKLVGADAAGNALQGQSVAISADGNTVIVGGPNDNSHLGAAWVYTRSGGAWAQQGPKLVGAGTAGNVLQGVSVAISGDGNTAVVGGPGGSYAGAAWVFTRSGSVWAQQGSKLVGTGAVGPAAQGNSVAISQDGGTAIVGGPADNAQVGAAWVFARSGQAWSQVGDKLVVTDAAGDSSLGTSVAISEDGSTAVVGGPADNGQAGAAWVFVVNGCAAPSISAQPQSESVQSGQTATLSVSANGQAPLSYQWYQGASGDTSQPVGTNASAFTTPALTVTTSYWVQVSNACGSAASATATVAVGCPPPAITAQPQSQTIQSGLSATLSVTATGAGPLSYQWFQGTSILGWAPVGGNASSYTTPALTAPTSYFVRVSNACGHTDSAVAAITVVAGSLPASQRQALLDLYTGTNGAGWKTLTNWNGAPGTECTWFGVTCDGGQTTVLQLKLEGNNLVGTIPADLGNLTSLLSLDLSANTLSGAIPPGLGNLAVLQTLRLSSNQLVGAVPNSVTSLTSLIAGDSDLRWNGLYSVNSAVVSFLSAKQTGGDWQGTQTVPVADLAPSAVAGSSVTLSWTPIAYTGDGGGYQVFYATTSGGPYTLSGTTASKTAGTWTVTSLLPDTEYRFVVRSVTYPNGNNQNTVLSDPSAEVAARTPTQVRRHLRRAS